MRKSVLIILGFIVWLLLAWPFSASYGVRWQAVIVGAVVALFTGLYLGDVVPGKGRGELPRRIFWGIYYVPVLFWYCLLANLDVVYRVFHPDMPIRPGIVKVKTTLKSDSGVTALCNSITLTPGTLTVDLTPDGYLYIHWINVQSEDLEEATEAIVRKFERILRRIYE